MDNTPVEKTDITTLLKTGMARQNAGQLAEAEAIYKEVLRQHPRQPDALHLLGVIALQVGKFPVAEQLISQAIALHPTAMMYFNLGNVLHMQKKRGAAINAYLQSIALESRIPEVHNNLGVVYRDEHRLDEALACYRQAMALRPDYAEACNNAGIIMRDKGKLLEATDYYQRAIAMQPGYAEAHNNLASNFRTRGQLVAAVESYLRAIALKPDYADAYNNLGNVYNAQGLFEAAVDSFRKSLAIKPQYADALSNLGNALQGLGRYDEAVDSYRHALLLEPKNVTAHSNLLFSLCFHSHITPEIYLEDARAYGEKVTAMAQPFKHWRCSPVNNDNSMLRVGLVSGDLKMHPVGYFIESIVAHLDKNRVQLVVYNTQPNEDAFSARIKSHCYAWHTLMGLPDNVAAQKIHDDGIHILIDLAGHTAHNRLPVFAWKPAPLQMTWLGYFNSTGVAEIDVVLADEVAVPPGNREHFTEQVVYLPHTRLCFTPPLDAGCLQLTPLPYIKNGYITFGCFQRLSKVNDAVLQLWGRVFRALPDARLRLQSKYMNDENARGPFLQKLAGFGIAPEQVQLSAEMPRDDYLAAHAEVDMILDTFPFPGGTTTCESLWMGVPTLTLCGDTMLARQGASLLSAAGLHQWIAYSADEYVEKAVQLATNPAALSTIRAGLRQQMAASPLVDGESFAIDLQQLLEQTWQQTGKARIEQQTS